MWKLRIRRTSAENILSDDTIQPHKNWTMNSLAVVGHAFECRRASIIICTSRRAIALSPPACTWVCAIFMYALKFVTLTAYHSMNMHACDTCNVFLPGWLQQYMHVSHKFALHSLALALRLRNMACIFLLKYQSPRTRYIVDERCECVCMVCELAATAGNSHKPYSRNRSRTWIIYYASFLMGSAN